MGRLHLVRDGLPTAGHHRGLSVEDRAAVAAATSLVSHPGNSPVVPSGARRGWVGTVQRQLAAHREVTIFVVLVALVIFFSVKSAAFYSYDNVVTIGQYIAPIAVIGAGEVLLLTLGEIDLSAGEIFLFSAWVVYWLQADGVPIGWAITIALFCSIAIGAINGLFTILFNVPSFVTTLGTYYTMLGLVLIVSNDAEVTMVGSTGRFGQIFGTSNWGELLWAVGLVTMFADPAEGDRLRVAHNGDGRQQARRRGVRHPCEPDQGLVFRAPCRSPAGFIGILDRDPDPEPRPGLAGDIGNVQCRLGCCDRRDRSHWRPWHDNRGLYRRLRAWRPRGRLQPHWRQCEHVHADAGPRDPRCHGAQFPPGRLGIVHESHDGIVPRGRQWHHHP